LSNPRRVQPQPNRKRDKKLEDQLAIDRANLEHWDQVRAEQIATGQSTDYGPDTVAVGDQVKISGQWYTVARCNTKTVTLETGYSWTRKAPWRHVQDRRPQTVEGH